MEWVTDKHGLIENQGGPTNLMAYEAKPEFCLHHSREEYRRLFKMLEPQNLDISGLRITIPHLAGVLFKADFDPDKIMEKLIKGPETCTRIGYSYVKREQTLVLQVAPENLPLFIGYDWHEYDYDKEHLKTLDTILEWRLTIHE